MDMAGIFQNNIIVVYFFVCIGLFVHSEMSEDQKMVILYLASYLACLLKIIPESHMVISVICIQFIYSEYLSEDRMKMEIITSIKFKLLDYLFQFSINYATWAFLWSLIMISDSVDAVVGRYRFLLLIIASFLVFALIHYLISKKFKIKSFDEIYAIFNQNPINLMPDNLPEEKIKILSDIEDKSFFARENTYNILSLEFLKYKIQQKERVQDERGKTNSKIMIILDYIKRTKNLRGYSTIEMQLLRTIGLEQGYNCMFRRKIFEFFYSKIFMTSLKQYYKEHQVVNWWEFKKYIIWVYYNTVPVEIDKNHYSSFKEIFNCEIENWPLEKMFVAILALSGRNAGKETLDLYNNIINQYDLNVAVIEYLSKDYDMNIYDFCFQLSDDLLEEIKGELEVNELLKKELSDIWKTNITVMGNAIKFRIYDLQKKTYEEVKKELKKIIDKDISLKLNFQ